MTIKSHHRGLAGRAALAAAVLASGLSLAACANGPGFEDEGSKDGTLEENAVKAVMTGLGAIDPHEKPIEYKPRPNLVVPPKRDLPSPQSGTVANAYFPRNPEDVAEERRAEAIKNDTGANGRVMSPEELARYRMPGAGKAERGPDDRERARPLSPEQMQGQFVATADAIKRAENPGQRQSLIEPPIDYRKPSANAPVELPPEAKSSWKPSWWPL